MTSRNFLKDILSTSLPTVEIMDIGAMQEGVDRYSPIIDQGLGRVTGFEPIPESQRELGERKGPYRYLPYFLGNGQTAKFYVTRYLGCSSLLEPNSDVINLFSTLGTWEESGGYRDWPFHVLKTLEVETVRLDDIDDIEFPDYVKIDVQGAELMVMENAIKTFSNVLILETEVEFVSIYKNQPLFGDIQKFLVGQGFIMHKMVDIAGRALRPITMEPKRTKAISQILWADAIFIKDYTNLQAFSNDQLLKTSLVLNDVYMSYDIVLHLLIEYDRRLDTNLAEKYGNALRDAENLEYLFMNMKETF